MRSSASSTCHVILTGEIGRRIGKIVQQLGMVVTGMQLFSQHQKREEKICERTNLPEIPCPHVRFEVAVEVCCILGVNPRRDKQKIFTPAQWHENTWLVVSLFPRERVNVISERHLLLDTIFLQASTGSSTQRHSGLHTGQSREQVLRSTPHTLPSSEMLIMVSPTVPSRKKFRSHLLAAGHSFAAPLKRTGRFRAM